MGDMGVYGQKLIQTPNLDGLCREGTRYLQAYTGTTGSSSNSRPGTEGIFLILSVPRPCHPYY